MIKKFYAGIGSRETPPNILKVMKDIAAYLSTRNYFCRTGYAIGADQAFYKGSEPNCIVYNPRNITLPYGGTSINCLSLENWEQALNIGKQFHARWDNLPYYVKNLIARNSYQVLGDDLNTPVDFVICWTPDGSTGKTTIKTGGTGQAIRIAFDRNIKVYNLANEIDLNFIKCVLLGLVEIN